MPDPNSLARYYAGWEWHHRRLINVIAPLTPEQLLLKAAPNMLSVGVMAAHILAARVFWFHGVMGEGPSEIARLSGLDDEDDSARPVETLLSGLVETWTLVEGVLARATPDNFEQTYVRRGKNRTYTRQWIIWRVLEHDIHHTGEISVTLGMHGLPGFEEW